MRTAAAFLALAAVTAAASGCDARGLDLAFGSGHPPPAHYQHLASQWFPGQEHIALTVLERESGGDPDAYNGRGRDDSHGLYQINLLAHAELVADMGYTTADLRDPAVNFEVARAVWDDRASWDPGGGWCAWSTGQEWCDR